MLLEKKKQNKPKKTHQKKQLKKTHQKTENHTRQKSELIFLFCSGSPLQLNIDSFSLTAGYSMWYNLVSACCSPESVGLHYITEAYEGVVKCHVNNKPQHILLDSCSKVHCRHPGNLQRWHSECQELLSAPLGAASTAMQEIY